MENYEDYLKQVADLGGANNKKTEPKENNANKKKLADFYHINKSLIRSFYAINSQIEQWINNKNLDEYGVNQILNSLNQHKAELASLKFEVSQTEISDFDGNIRTKLEKQLNYIKNEMVLEEAHFALSNLKQIKNTPKPEPKVEPKVEPKPEPPKNDFSFLRIFLKTEYGEGYTYEGDLLNNLPNGNGALYYPNKQLYAIGTWANGRLQNQAKVYYNDGKLWQVGSFLNGKLEGNGKEFYYNYNEERICIVACYEGEYKFGNLLGNGRVYTNEKLRLEGLFDSNGKINNVKIFLVIDAKINEYFEGQILQIKKTTGFILGEGVLTREFLNENLSYRSKCSSIDLSLFNDFAKYNGRVLCYQNNTLKWDSIYENGIEKFGKSYNDDGSLWFEGEYQQDSRRISQPKSGKKYLENYLWKEGDFLDYQLHGKGKIYYKNSQLREVGFFKKNELEGNGIKYLENGKIHEEGTFKNGTLNGVGKRYYFDNGVLFEDGNFKDGYLHGKGIRYDYGVLRVLEQGTFINGVFQGK
ncbi:MAG: hypothetical protein U0V04_19500 [Spirosomataceae bacterium]